MTTVGVLAIQGDYREHRILLESLGADVKEIRLPDQLDEVDGLIIPGGESTTIVQLIDIYDMREKLRDRVLNEGMPTCRPKRVSQEGTMDVRAVPDRMER